MGYRRRTRGRYDGARRRGVLVEEHRLSVSAFAFAVAVTLVGCKEVETKQIFFRVTDVGEGCQIRDCLLVTLQCVGSVQAVLTPEHGSPVMGVCTKPTGVTTTLCDPTRLFPQPLFDQVSEPRVKLTIVGYQDDACITAIFTAETAMFDVALAAASSTKTVDMTASCSMKTICAQVLNVQGNMVSWPPNATRDPPQIPGLNGYNVKFGYSFSDPLTPAAINFRKLFDVSYNPLPNVDHALTGMGQLTDDARSDFARCVGYEATSDPAVGLTTLTCVDKTLLSGTVQRLDAYYVSTSIADAAKTVSGRNGVLLVRVIRGGTTGPGLDRVIAHSNAMDRLFYYDSMRTKFVQTMTETDVSGVFAVVGTEMGGLVTIDALNPIFGSTPTYTQVILPNVATVFELPL